MGGIGSGRRWHLGAKESTDNYRSIDIRRWKRRGILKPGQSFHWRWLLEDEVIGSIHVRVKSNSVVLTYRHRTRGKGWEEKSYPIAIDWTDCNLGGQRPWFICPAKSCGRRVAILYGGNIFACRHCYELTYASQIESPGDRAARKANRLREKLGWKPGIFSPTGRKPKGMHWATFQKLRAQQEAHTQKALRGIMVRLNMSGELPEE